LTNPNLSQNQRARVYPEIQKRYPECCSNCQKTLDECNLKPFDPVTRTGGFELHHTRYDMGMMNPNVIRFMCHSCNHLEEFSKKIILAYENELSASQKTNLEKHPIFLAWFSNKIAENNYHLPLSEVVNGGARISGAHVKTVRDWLKPLAYSDESPFTVIRVLGIDTVCLKGKEPRLELPNRYVELFNDEVQKYSK